MLSSKNKKIILHYPPHTLLSGAPICYKVKVKVSHSLVAIRSAGVRSPPYPEQSI